jgi:hypothetical protein
MRLFVRISIMLLALLPIGCGLTIIPPTPIPTIVVPPTDTPVPATATAIPSTDTPVPVTAAAIPSTETPVPPTLTSVPTLAPPPLPTQTALPTNTPAPTPTSTPVNACQQLEKLDPASAETRAIAEDAIATGPVGSNMSLGEVLYAYRLQGWVLISFTLNEPADGPPFVMRPLSNGQYETAALLPPAVATEEDLVTEVQLQAPDAPPDLTRCWIKTFS